MRNSVHFEDQGSSRTPLAKPVAHRTPAAPVAAAGRDARANPVLHSVPTESTPIHQAVESPQPVSVTNAAQNNMVLTSSDGGTINMGDFMNAIMLQIKTVDKVM